MHDQEKPIRGGRSRFAAATVVLTMILPVIYHETLGCYAKAPPPADANRQSSSGGRPSAAKRTLAAAASEDFAVQHLHYLPNGQSILASSNLSSRLLDGKTGALIRSFTTLGPGASDTRRNGGGQRGRDDARGGVQRRGDFVGGRQRQETLASQFGFLRGRA